MTTPEFYWKVFKNTGSPGAYLILKANEKENKEKKQQN